MNEYQNIFSGLLILLFCLISCTPVASQKNNSFLLKKNKSTTSMEQEGNAFIEKWLESRQISLEEIQKQAITIEQEVGYEHLDDLTRVNFNETPDVFYFFDENGVCILIYIESEELLEQISTTTIAADYGKPKANLRSNAGKSANHLVYAKKGFAFSEKNGKVLYLEIFEPQGKGQYKRKFYEAPPAFVR